MTIQEVQSGDIGAVVQLLEQRRKQYQVYQPVFWRKSADSAESTGPYLETLMHDPDAVFLVAIAKDEVVGFVIARKIDTPTVYSPGGATFVIDDFCVSNDKHWLSTGSELLNAVSTALRSRDVAQVVVVCGDRDLAKAEFLRRSGYSIASNWWTQPLR